MAGVDRVRGVRSAVLLGVCTAAALLLAVGGCHGDSSAPPPVAAKPLKAAPAPVKSGPTSDQLTAGMVEAAVQGKAALPLKLKFELAQRPKVGQPLEIDLALIPQLAGSSLSIQIAASDGIVSSMTQSFELLNVEPGEVYRHTVRLTPAVEGVLLVGLNVSLKHDEVTESTAFSIPIIADR